MLTGKLPKRNGRFIRRQKRRRHVTLAAGARVALGHGKGLRVGRISHFRHGLGTLEACVVWGDGLSTTIRLDALRPASSGDRKAERRTAGEALDTIHETRAAILQALGALDAIHNDERLKLPKAHSMSLQAALESLEGLPDELAELGEHVETLAGVS